MLLETVLVRVVLPARLALPAGLDLSALAIVLDGQAPDGLLENALVAGGLARIAQSLLACVIRGPHAFMPSQGLTGRMDPQTSRDQAQQRLPGELGPGGPAIEEVDDLVNLLRRQVAGHCNTSQSMRARTQAGKSRRASATVGPTHVANDCARHWRRRAGSGAPSSMSSDSINSRSWCSRRSDLSACSSHRSATAVPASTASSAFVHSSRWWSYIARIHACACASPFRQTCSQQLRQSRFFVQGVIDQSCPHFPYIVRWVGPETPQLCCAGVIGSGAEHGMEAPARTVSRRAWRARCTRSDSGMWFVEPVVSDAGPARPLRQILLRHGPARGDCAQVMPRLMGVESDGAPIGLAVPEPREHAGLPTPRSEQIVDCVRSRSDEAIPVNRAAGMEEISVNAAQCVGPRQTSLGVEHREPVWDSDTRLLPVLPDGPESPSGIVPLNTLG